MSSVRSNEEFRVRFAEAEVAEAEVDPSHGWRGTAAKHSPSRDISMPPRRRCWLGRRVHDTQRLGSGMLSVCQKRQRLFLRAAIAFMTMFISLSSSAGAASTAATLRPPSMVRPLGTLRVLPTKAEIDICLRLVVASLGGAAVGLERSSSDRPAGVRTMALVSLGAAVFTICSMYGFLPVTSDVVGARVDPSRMASNIVSGVGFIGAGVITNNRQSSGVYDRHSSVNGLTTAAAIWVSAAVGVACGVGMYVVGASAAASTIAILRFGRVKNTDLGKRVMSIGTKRSPTSNTSLSTNTVSGITEQAEGVDETLSLQVDKDPPVVIAGDGLARRSKLSREDVMPQGKSAVNNDAPNKSEWILETETTATRLGAAAIDISTPLSIQGADTDPATIRKTSSMKGTRMKTAKTKDGGNGNDGAKSSRKLVDPLLEKYLWGENDGLSIPPNNSQSFELAKPPPQQIEEGQEIVVRSTGSTRSSGNDGAGGSE